ncbi:hypothetical protein V6R85_24140 [Agrobacterium sp. CCNWLW32]|uniref:hypothetical protein n=1 Tax=Agrobacterium sp. CCNWLW32 TaxID=3122072 RepID=UPI0030100F86
MTKIQKMLRAAIKAATEAERVKITRDGELFIMLPRDNEWLHAGPLDSAEDALCRGCANGRVREIHAPEVVAYRVAMDYPAEGLPMPTTTAAAPEAIVEGERTVIGLFPTGSRKPTSEWEPTVDGLVEAAWFARPGIRLCIGKVSVSAEDIRILRKAAPQEREWFMHPDRIAEGLERARRLLAA